MPGDNFSQYILKKKNDATSNYWAGDPAKHSEMHRTVLCKKSCELSTPNVNTAIVERVYISIVGEEYW